MWRPDLGEMVLPMTAVVSVRGLRKVYGPTVAVAMAPASAYERDTAEPTEPVAPYTTTTRSCIDLNESISSRCAGSLPSLALFTARGHRPIG